MTRPESSASAGSPLASAAALAFKAALASKVSPVSSGSGMPRPPAETTATSKSASKATISSILPGLWLAITNRSPPKCRGTASAEPERGPLMPRQIRDTRPREPQHLGEERFVERSALRCRLDLDDPARPGQHKVRVGLGLRILGIIEVEHGKVGDNAA